MRTNTPFADFIFKSYGLSGPFDSKYNQTRRCMYMSGKKQIGQSPFHTR